MRVGFVEIFVRHLGYLRSWCVLSPQRVSITEEWELLAHEVKVDNDLERRADPFCNLCTWLAWTCNQALVTSGNVNHSMATQNK